MIFGPFFDDVLFPIRVAVVAQPGNSNKIPSVFFLHFCTTTNFNAFGSRKLCLRASDLSF